MSRNPIARDLRSPKYRQRVIPSKRAWLEGQLTSIDAQIDAFFDSCAEETLRRDGIVRVPATVISKPGDVE